MNINIPIVVFALTICSANASSVLTSKNGEVYNFGDWSKQAAVNAQSKDGATKLSIQSCFLKKDHGGATITNIIDAVFSPSGKDVFVGERATSYALVEGKVLALYPSGRVLKIGTSKSVDSDRVLDGGLTSYVDQDPISSYSYVDFGGIFGISALRGKKATLASCTTLLSNVVDSDGITLSMMTAGSNTLSLKLDSSFKVLSATIDGKYIYALNEAVGDSSLPVDFPTIRTANGYTKAIRSTQNYSAEDESYIASSKTIVSLDTGSVWAGPESCQVVDVNGKLIGATVDKDKKTINIYTTTIATLPKSRDSIAIFNKALQMLKNSYKANAYKSTPDFEIDLKDAFPEILKTDGEYRLRDLLVSGNGNIMIRINCPTDVYPEITIDPKEMKVISTRTIDGGSSELATKPAFMFDN